MRKFFQINFQCVLKRFQGEQIFHIRQFCHLWIKQFRKELKEKVFDFFIDYNEEWEVSIATDDNAYITGNIIIETLGIHFILIYLKRVTL